MQECMRQQEYRSEKSPLRLIMERVEAGVQLMPDWHDDTLMVPNCLVRSSPSTSTPPSMVVRVQSRQENITAARRLSPTMPIFDLCRKSLTAP
jgi:hypothetical protein